MKISLGMSGKSFLGSMTFLLAVSILLFASLTGCGGGGKAVAFDTLEDARSQARENALYNAQLYRIESPRLGDFKIVSHGDSTQDPKCPQGDGWATVSFMKVDEREQDKFVKYVAKCSTVSRTLGCYLDKDFEKKPFAQDENHCQPTSKVPFPLPKIGK